MAEKRNGNAPPPGLVSAFLDCRKALGRVVRQLARPDDVDDILQEAFIRAYVASKSTEIRHPRAFIVKTARNVALNEVLSAKNQRTRSIEDFSASIHPCTDTLESEFEAKERFLGFCRAVRALPVQCRRVFVLKKVYGLSQQEIAEHLGISESTVEKHVAKGLLMCARSMRDAGHAVDFDGERAMPKARGKKNGHD